jgi:nicotinate-nucleotide adenylyltransferase
LSLHVTRRSRARSVAIFGGSFDPVHVGHLAAARAAQRRFHLDEVHFVVSGRHPFAAKKEQAAFPHRYAMVALACAEHPHFVPSLAEAGEDASGLHVHYSFETARRFRQQLRRSDDRLYFITGADSFLEIPMWKNYETLLDTCDFIVLSRPGYKLDPLRLVIPPDLLRRARPGRGPQREPFHPHGTEAIRLRRTSVFLFDGLRSSVSSTEIRRRRRRGESIHGLVPVRVEEYILRQALYS